jgi:hypothetical protein
VLAAGLPSAELALQPGYDYGNEFEFGLSVILGPNSASAS